MATTNPNAEEYEKIVDSAEKLNRLLNAAKLVWKDTRDIVDDITKSYRELSRSSDLREQLEEKNLKTSERLQKQLDKVKNLSSAFNITELLQQKRIADSRKNQSNISVEQRAKYKGISEELEKQIKAAIEFNQKKKEEVELLEKAIKAEKINERIANLDKLIGKTKSFLSSFLGINISFMGILSMLYEADKTVTRFSNSLGIAKEQGFALRKNMDDFAKSSGDAALSAERLMQAQLGLADATGQAIIFTNEQAQAYNTLTKRIGVSEEAAKKLALISFGNGVIFEKITGKILAGNLAQAKSNKLHMDAKEVLESIGRLSAGILVKFQGNPEALGAAVAQAKKLGLSLDQVDKIGESLLNWESSIENELKAELLTSKELNLERARAAALTGDQATLMAEIANQAGTLEDFTKLNVIAQGALAGAFGLSRDEMSEMLMRQEAINVLGDKAKLLNDEQLEQYNEQKIRLGENALSLEDFLTKQVAQQELQDQFNVAIDKMKEALIPLAEQIMPKLVGLMETLANNAGLLKFAIGAIASMSLGRLIASLVQIAMTAYGAAASSIAMASALTLGVSAIAIGGAIAYLMSQADEAADKAQAKYQTVQDGASPSSRGPFTVIDRFGAIGKTTEGDNIFATPNNISRNNNNTDNTSGIVNQITSGIAKAMSGIKMTMNEQNIGVITYSAAKTSGYPDIA
jgi:hypothetical protein